MYTLTCTCTLHAHVFYVRICVFRSRYFCVIFILLLFIRDLDFGAEFTVVEFGGVCSSLLLFFVVS